MNWKDKRIWIGVLIIILVVGLFSFFVLHKIEESKISKCRDMHDEYTNYIDNFRDCNNDGDCIRIKKVKPCGTCANRSINLGTISDYEDSLSENNCYERLDISFLCTAVLKRCECVNNTCRGTA